jgi:hypothetical protein
VKKALAIALLAVVTLAACNSQPAFDSFEVTRIVEITVTVISEVEVTRPVEITRLIEVVVEVTKETEKEVTRVVDNIITATPRPTREPTNTPAPTATVPTAPGTSGQEGEVDPAVEAGSQLLVTMKTVLNDMQSYGFMIDAGLGQGYLVCQPIIERHDRVAAAPAFDIAGASTVVQNAYHNYQDALSIFIPGVNSLTLNCRNFVLEPTPTTLKPPRASIGACIGPNQAFGCRGFIPNHQWTEARLKVNEADDILAIAISNLDPLYDIPE